MPHESPERISDDIQSTLQQAILNNYPNPERRGCLGSDALRQVAGREEPIRDAVWEHVTHCSPCYGEFLVFRRDVVAARRRLVRRNQLLVVAALFVGAIAGVAIWRTIPGHGQPSGPPASVVTVDLRPFGPTRSEAQPSASRREVAMLERRLMQLQISLPVGSDEGTYQVRLMDSELRPLMSQTAQTTFEDHVAKLSVTFDLSRMSPGSYVFGVRGPDGVWRTYPIAVR